MFQIKTFTFNPVQENTYILYNENNECIIIDPGCYFDSEKEELTAFIKNHKLEPQLLLNTHCHLDHVFGNKFIAEEFKLTLNTHLLEKEILEMAPASGLIFNLPFDNYQGDVIYLKEGDVISLGDDKLQVIHAPGHSPGSIYFYCEKQNFLIGGDVLFQNSIGRTDLPYGDHDALIKNIKEKLFKLPPAVTVYPGHGPETTIGSEIKGNPYLQ
ncbi:MBL fold metallo-hydrolase [Hanamia caeni]|uniref:MBL fold metallo-hydrolase n=1 Tax=Hanamia caeni TaxID=2294116 RepID=A0A3M9NPG2_9BACT|nr:MBL fold metallo-hydrolase [Hanamia caeni]RNI39063.1 MBL fold metallo-hydrolase [Hanamia caeni]